LGFKYREHIFRTNEIITSARVVDNMRGLANEINGNLDRENLPLSSISTNMVVDDTFNSIIHKFSAVSDVIISGSFQEVDPVSTSVDVSLNSDAMIIAHFGCYFEWGANSAPLEELLVAQGKSAVQATNLRTRFDGDRSKSDDGSATDPTVDDYFELREFYIDFEMRVNGLVIAKSEYNNAFRKKFHVSLTGATPASAGNLAIKVYARMRRNNQSKIEDVDGFDVGIRDRTLVVEIKTR
tara:strand:+ start:122 stop:838 length:717 start_codon:yes stop_codon:yes gene_type:complete